MDKTDKPIPQQQIDRAISVEKTREMMRAAGYEDNSPAELLRLRQVEQAAHDLLCWTYQHEINVEPAEYSRHVRNLAPGIYEKLNAAEQKLYLALMGYAGAFNSPDTRQKEGKD